MQVSSKTKKNTPAWMYYKCIIWNNVLKQTEKITKVALHVGNISVHTVKLHSRLAFLLPDDSGFQSKCAFFSCAEGNGVQIKASCFPFGEVMRLGLKCFAGIPSSYNYPCDTAGNWGSRYIHTLGIYLWPCVCLHPKCGAIQRCWFPFKTHSERALFCVTYAEMRDVNYIRLPQMPFHYFQIRKYTELKRHVQHATVYNHSLTRTRAHTYTV